MLTMFKQTLALVCLTLSLSANAAVVEVGDLNIINDGGNASDGLRFLDLTYSVGLARDAALINAQATYANARLANGNEWDDLFAAAGIVYSGTLTASDGFTSGSTTTISSDARLLIQQFGLTVNNPFDGERTLIFTDPDQSTAFNSTRDITQFSSMGVQLFQSPTIGTNSAIGWLIVSDVPAPVPVPAAVWLFGSGLIGLIGLARRKKA